MSEDGGGAKRWVLLGTAEDVDAVAAQSNDLVIAVADVRSDVAAVSGELDALDQRVTNAQSVYNRYRPIAFYTLLFGAGGKGESMQLLSIRNDGTFTAPGGKKKKKKKKDN